MREVRLAADAAAENRLLAWLRSSALDLKTIRDVGGAPSRPEEKESDETLAVRWGDQLVVWRGEVWSVRSIAAHLRVGITDIVVSIYEGKFKE